MPNGWQNNVRFTCGNGLFSSIAVETIAEPDDIRIEMAIPGLCNLHSHAFQRAMAGLSETRGPTTDSFWSWREQMYRFALTMSPDDVEAVASLLYVEMLEAGFTRAGEFHYLHHDKDGHPYANIAEMAERIAAASDVTGISLTLLPVLYTYSGFGGTAPGEGQRRFINDTSRYEKLWQASQNIVQTLAGANIGVAPHSLRAVTAKQLIFVKTIAGNRPIHIHIAEQVKEVQDCIASSGARPVEWLLANMPVDQRWCLIHATHMSAAETTTLAQSRAVAGLCPITEANLGDGIFNGPEYLSNNGRFGIGSDSNIEISAAGELRMLEYSQRLATRQRNVMAGAGTSTGRTLLEAAHAGGAQALGQTLTGFRIGASFDLVGLQAKSPETGELKPDQWLDSWIFSPGHVNINSVWARGSQLVENGQHKHRHKISARFSQTMAKLLA